MAKPKLPSHPHHPLYVPGLLSTAQISSLDWSKIINTPTTRDGYGITDVYTQAEADAEFLTQAEADALYAALSHTHAAADVVSGTFADARIAQSNVTQHEAALSIGWGQLTSVPTTLAGYGIDDDVAALLAALELDDLADVVITSVADGDVLTWDSGTSQWVNEAPTPGGAFDLDDAGDVVITTPADGDVLTYDSGSGDWINSPASGGTLDGTGSAIRHAYWTDSDTLAASVLLENNNPGVEEGIQLVPDVGRATIVMQADNVTPGQSATNPGWTIRADTDAGGGVFEIIENWDGDTVLEIGPTGASIDFPVVGVDFTTGTVRIDAQNGTDEGGEVQLLGAAANDDWTLDNFQGRTRLFSGATEHFNWQRGSFNVGYDATADDAHLGIGSAGAGGSTNLAIGYVGVTDNYQIRYNDDMEGNAIDAAKPSWAVPIGEGASDTFSIYRKPPGGSYVSLWVLNNAGHWTPGVSASRDIGTPSLRVRNVYAQAVLDSTGGELVTSAGTIIMVGSGSSWTQLNLYQAGTARWHIVSGGHFYPVADNTYDIGSSALAVRSLYLDTSLIVNGVTRINTTQPVHTASTTTVQRTATTNATTLANLAQQVGTLRNDLRSIGILA